MVAAGPRARPDYTAVMHRTLVALAALAGLPASPPAAARAGTFPAAATPPAASAALAGRTAPAAASASAPARPAAALAPASGASGAARKAPAQASHRPARHSRHPVAADDAPDKVLYGHREDVVAFAQELAATRGLDAAWVEAALARARYQPSVARLVMPAPGGSAKNWAAYSRRFIEPRRIGAGLAWWRAHAQELERAQARFGVPPEIVAGIVGVETFYGRLRGSYRVLDALATLAFDFPKGRTDRSAFYRDELAAYLDWCAREKRAADTTRGSYAGAIGWPQFMPSSILQYAIDFDGDGRIDLDDGGAAVVGSVASYLARFGWQSGVPTTFAVLPPADPAARALLLAPDITPSFSAAELLAQGAELPESARSFDGRLALVELQNGDAPPSYVAGTRNFYVITRYNWSAYYAMAVIELAQALRREMSFGPAAQVPPAPEPPSTAPAVEPWSLSPAPSPLPASPAPATSLP